ncbi:MAG: hypothetical protein MI784_03355 [Cytophagales bacterium]|nr:hypothetical protein [Cytophagales bacterium]
MTSKRKILLLCLLFAMLFFPLQYYLQDNQTVEEVALATFIAAPLMGFIFYFFERWKGQ